LAFIFLEFIFKNLMILAKFCLKFYEISIRQLLVVFDYYSFMNNNENKEFYQYAHVLKIEEKCLKFMQIINYDDSLDISQTILENIGVNYIQGYYIGKPKKDLVDD